MITLFLVPAVFATIVRTICIVQTKWREKQRYFAMFARNVDIDTKNIDLEEYVSMQKKSIADMCNVPEEKVIPISRLEYETYTDE